MHRTNKNRFFDDIPTKIVWIYLWTFPIIFCVILLIFNTDLLLSPNANDLDNLFFAESFFCISISWYLTINHFFIGERIPYKKLLLFDAVNLTTSIGVFLFIETTSLSMRWEQKGYAKHYDAAILMSCIMIISTIFLLFIWIFWCTSINKQKRRSFYITIGILIVSITTTIVLSRGLTDNGFLNVYLPKEESCSNIPLDY